MCVFLRQNLLIEDIAWREEIDMVRFQAMTLEEVVGVERDAFEEHYWSQLLGHDDEDENCPIFFRRQVHKGTWACCSRRDRS